MAPGDLDPRLLSGRWRLSLADYFMPKRSKEPKPAAQRKTGGERSRGCCAPGCCP